MISCSRCTGWADAPRYEPVGITKDAFPKTSELIRFLRGCVQAGLPFKATAGLHHPLRAEYRLTYAPDSPTGVMFGFLNLFLATAFLRAGMAESEAARLLEEAFFRGDSPR